MSAPPPPADRPLSQGLVNRIVREWLPLVILGFLFAALVRDAARPLQNTDTYFHLRFGAEFLDGSWTLRNPGSVSSFATEDWVPTQWVSQVAMAQVEDWWGLPGVAFLGGTLFVIAASCFYLAARQRADRLAAATVCAVAVIGCAPSLSMRPQVVSYLLSAVAVAAWLRAADRGRPPWLLVPLTWVWVTAHGMWPVSVVISVVAAVGVVLDLRPGVRGSLLYFGVPACSLVAALATPVGWGSVTAVMTVGARRDYFAEWAPTDFTSPAPLGLLALAVAATLCLTRRKGPWLEVLLVGLACGWALWSSRGVPVGAAMLVPLTAGALQQLVGPRPGVTLGELRVLVATGLAATAALALLVPRTSDEPLPHPDWLDPALSELPAGTPVLNDWGWGGYLMWRHPQLDLVMHGYGDTFTMAELERNVDIEHLEPGWDDLVRGTGAEHAVLRTDSRLAYALSMLDWHELHSDDDLVFLEAPADWLARD